MCCCSSSCVIPRAKLSSRRREDGEGCFLSILLLLLLLLRVGDVVLEGCGSEKGFPVGAAIVCVLSVSPHMFMFPCRCLFFDSSSTDLEQVTRERIFCLFFLCIGEKN